jgi:hypothetical protein
LLVAIFKIYFYWFFYSFPINSTFYNKRNALLPVLPAGIRLLVGGAILEESILLLEGGNIAELFFKESVLEDS